MEADIEEKGYEVIKESFSDYKYALDNHKDYIRRYYESNNKYQSLEFKLKTISDDYQLMYAVQVDWRTYSGVILRDKEGRIVRRSVVKEIQNKEIQRVINEINKIIENDNRYQSSDSWLLWKYTHPTINFRNLNDGDSQRHLSRMKETIESISKDIIDNINMILKEKHEKIL